MNLGVADSMTVPRTRTGGGSGSVCHAPTMAFRSACSAVMHRLGAALKENVAAPQAVAGRPSLSSPIKCDHLVARPNAGPHATCKCHCRFMD